MTQARRHAFLDWLPFTQPVMTEEWISPIDSLPGNYSQTFDLTLLWRFSRPCIIAVLSLEKTSNVATVHEPLWQPVGSISKNLQIMSNAAMKSVSYIPRSTDLLAFVINGQLLITLVIDQRCIVSNMTFYRILFARVLILIILFRKKYQY